MILCRGCIFVALLALSACGSDTPTAEPIKAESAAEALTPPAADVASIATYRPTLAVDAQGLRLFNKQSGSARPIAYGTARNEVLQMLAFRGKPETGETGECGAGPLDFANWADGLGLFFKKDKFVGWNLNPRGEFPSTTASGIGVGSSRGDLEAAYAVEISETSLGTEFAAGELFGILDGKGEAAKITNMWGGVSCNFR